MVQQTGCRYINSELKGASLQSDCVTQNTYIVLKSVLLYIITNHVVHEYAHYGFGKLFKTCNLPLDLGKALQRLYPINRYITSLK